MEKALQNICRDIKRISLETNAAEWKITNGKMNAVSIYITCLFTSRHPHRLWLCTPSYYALPYSEDVLEYHQIIASSEISGSPLLIVGERTGASGEGFNRVEI